MDSSTRNGELRLNRERADDSRAAAARIVLTYAVVAVSWILFSDTIARIMFADPDLLTRASNVKGALFVLVTSALLFVRIRGDFSRLHESGERLAESEYRARRIIDVSPVPMAMYDGDGTVTLTNNAFTEMLGYTTQDIPTLSVWWTTAYPDPTYRQQIADTWQKETERSQQSGEPFVPVEARIHTKDGTERFMLVNAASLGPTSAEQVVVFYDLTEREEAEESLLQSHERLAQSLKGTISLIGNVVEARDPYTRGHEEGVARIGRMIAEEMGCSAAEVDRIEVAGLVHDVGKLAVPAEILTKPGKITALEFELIKVHPQTGYDILNGIDFGWPVAETILQHHERMDGSGYPRGLAGDEISMDARILMVADVIEAMAAHRPYRPALGVDAAIEEITSHPEKFDPKVIAACGRLYEAGRIEV